ncbi:MAG: hypothetical protein JOZ52_00620 [Acidobacteria bacterium]|nr:hypothetical protein [Acidobacteriota bacterium]
MSELLAQKKDEKSAEQSQQTNPRRTPWRELSAAGARRLALANSLLDAGEALAAARVAAPLVNEGASADLITFLLRLHELEASEAKQLYLRLLERMSADAQSDANDVLLFAAPVISPKLLVVVDNQGALQFRTVEAASQPFNEFLRPGEESRLFSRVAATILLRPRLGASSMPDTITLYFTIGRLLPYFEQLAAQYAPDLRLRSSALMNSIEANRRDSLSESLKLDTLTPERAGDPLRAQLDQLGRARDSRDRDRIALGGVKKAAQFRYWDRARRAALEIEDLNARHLAQSYIAVCQIADLLHTFQNDKENNFESMAKFTRSADVPPLASAWGLAQAAVIAARRGDAKSAAALLDEAQTYAARTRAGTWERAAAYIMLARLAANLHDSNRVWELAPEAVRAANAVEDYAGDEAAIDIRADDGNAVEEEVLEPLGVEAEVFRLDGFFATIASLDEDKALTAARSLGRETPRAFAMLAVAKVMLGKVASSQ